MIKQRDKALPVNINNYGCYLMSIIFITCKRFRVSTKNVSATDIIKIYERALEHKYVDEEIFISNPRGLVEVIKDYFAVGDNTHWSYINAHSKKYKRETEDMFIIGVWKYKYTHFVVMDGEGSIPENVWYDPIDNSYSVGRVEMKSTRIYKNITNKRKTI